MRKQILGLCALALTISASLAGETTLTSLQGLPICGLHASHSFAVTLRQSTRIAENGVKITIDERLEPYLEVALRESILYLGFKELPRELRVFDEWCRPAVAEVTLSRLDRLAVSGFASVKPVGAFSGAAALIETSGFSKIDPIVIRVAGNEDSEINLSGISSADITLKGAKGADIKVIGKSTLTLDCGTVRDLGINIGSISSATVKGGALSMKVECSGSSKLSLDCGAIRSFDISTFGVSSVIASGSADKVDAESGGNSKIDLKNLKAKDVVCKASGVSGITVWTTGSLDAHVSGNSAIRYRADGYIRLNTDNSGRGSISTIR